MAFLEYHEMIFQIQSTYLVETSMLTRMSCLAKLLKCVILPRKFTYDAEVWVKQKIKALMSAKYN